MYRRFPKLTKPRVRACKICASSSPLLGSIDFHKRSSGWGEVVLPPSGDMIFYNRCNECGFLFSSSFDRWSEEDFATFIYNEDYHLIDREVDEVRPQECAIALDNLCRYAKANISVLDYGSGTGRLAEILREKGFADVVSYDPFLGDTKYIENRKFDLVSCFEVLEHVTNPKETIGRIASLLKDDGIVYHRTEILSGAFEERGLFWDYVTPRTGHISIFSDRALALLWSEYGFYVGSFGYCDHIASRSHNFFVQATAERPDFIVRTP